MKFKILTKEQLIISIDRLTRFKNTKEKYLRVFSDILSLSLLEPKFRKADIETIDFLTLKTWVEEIINNSIVKLGSINSGNRFINRVLMDYENSVFYNDEETQILLNNNIDYFSFINHIPNNSPVNLNWLKELGSLAYENNSCEIKNIRIQKLLKYPIEEVLIVEGVTEEILLPVFAQKLGLDFNARGIQIIAAGGKNQVVKLYYKLAEELKLPIYVLLDKDAEENIKQIEPRLRPIDKIHLVSCGEFEDLLPKTLIIKTINSHFKNFLSVSYEDLEQNLPMVKILEEIFKTKGLHEFKKAEFAKLVSEEVTAINDISSEIAIIIEEIVSK